MFSPITDSPLCQDRNLCVLVTRLLVFLGKIKMSSGRTEVWSDGIYQYQLSAYEALCDVCVQLSLFALLADCMIPLYCLLDFSFKNKQTIYCSLEKDR